MCLFFYFLFLLLISMRSSSLISSVHSYLMHAGGIPRQKQSDDADHHADSRTSPHKMNWNVYLVNLLGISAIKQLTAQMSVHNNETRFHLSLKSAISIMKPSSTRYFSDRRRVSSWLSHQIQCQVQFLNSVISRRIF